MFLDRIEIVRRCEGRDQVFHSDFILYLGVSLPDLPCFLNPNFLHNEASATLIFVLHGLLSIRQTFIQSSVDEFMNLEFSRNLNLFPAWLLVAIVPSGPCWHLIRLVGSSGVGRSG